MELLKGTLVRLLLSLNSGQKTKSLYFISLALDIQNCNITEQTATKVLQMLKINTALVILDIRQNAEISSESLSKVRATLREHERGVLGGQVSTTIRSHT